MQDERFRAPKILETPKGESNEFDRQNLATLRELANGEPSPIRPPRPRKTRGGTAEMRAVLQRVSSAGVTVRVETVGEIGPGLLVLLGVEAEDTPEDARYLAERPPSCAFLKIRTER